MSLTTIVTVIFTVFTFKIGLLWAIQEYRACADSYSCTSYCKDRGFNDKVCKTITVDESPEVDGTLLVNRRICLCSESSQGYGESSATGEYFRYWFSPGHECIRNGSDRTCKEYCKRIRISPEMCECSLSSCKFPKTRLTIPLLQTISQSVSQTTVPFP